mgnify:CR=1 FL=1
MHLDKKGIHKLNRITRLNLINSITGVKTINLIGTIDKDSVTNLAIFSYIVHISSNPALLGFFVRTNKQVKSCLLYTSPSPRDRTRSRMPSSA